jgi:ornithine carbamoyltransferase
VIDKVLAAQGNPTRRGAPMPAAAPDLIRIKLPRAAPHTVAPVHTLPPLGTSRLLSQRTLAAARIFELFAAAGRIRRDLRSDAGHHPLRGKNVAMLLTGPASSEASTLQRAASELGARVSQVRYRHPDGATQPDLAPMARTLGQMYDAIDCGCLPAATVRRIEQAAGVPVYDGLGLDNHPARMLADLMTLYEHPRPPSVGATIRFLGEQGSAQGQAFVSAARNIGFHVIGADDPPDAANEATFVVDGCNPMDWPMRAGSSAFDEERRAENHRSVIQAVLIDTIARA